MRATSFKNRFIHYGLVLLLLSTSCFVSFHSSEHLDTHTTIAHELPERPIFSDYLQYYPERYIALYQAYADQHIDHAHFPHPHSHDQHDAHVDAQHGVDSLCHACLTLSAFHLSNDLPALIALRPFERHLPANEAPVTQLTYLAYLSRAPPRSSSQSISRPV